MTSGNDEKKSCSEPSTVLVCRCVYCWIAAVTELLECSSELEPNMIDQRGVVAQLASRLELATGWKQRVVEGVVRTVSRKISATSISPANP